MRITEGGLAAVISATGDVTTATTQLLGFYVSSTSAGTIVLKEGGASGTAISGTITPAVGFQPAHASKQYPQASAPYPQPQGSWLAGNRLTMLGSFERLEKYAVRVFVPDST